MSSSSELGQFILQNSWYTWIELLRTELDFKVHVNEQTAASLKKYLVTTGFNSKIWLGSEYVTPVKKDSTSMQLLEVFRQMLCHAYPLSLLPPFNSIFCNDIWAIAKKV